MSEKTVDLHLASEQDHPVWETGIQIKESVTVVIVGAGPTGLSIGNFLGIAGIDTLIVERNTGLSSYPRAIALDDEGLRICQAMGLGTAVSKSILADIVVHYISGRRLLAKVAPTNKLNGHPPISTFYQPEIEAILLDGLKRFTCARVRFQHTVETFEQRGDSVVVSIRTPEGTLQQVNCAYLLACDGGKSTIRHRLNIPMKGTTFPQKWLVIDCIADKEPSTVVKFFCNPHRPAVTVPYPNNGRRWEFMLLPGETEKDLLEKEGIPSLIQQAGGSPHLQIVRQMVYTFHSTLAQSFSQGRVFLLGDAAHMMPPFGGQGLNSGLRDAHNLSWKISMVLQGLATSQLLETYHQERYRHVAQMIRLSSFLGSIVMSTAQPVAFCRNIILCTLNIVPAVRKFLAEAGLKPQPRYKTGFLLSDGTNKAITGALLPQPEVTTLQGQRVLLDEMLGPGFTLLRLHHNPEEAFAAIKANFWERLGVRCVCVQPESMNSERQDSYKEQPASTGANSPPFIIVKSNDKNFLSSLQDQFIVIRPDRYVLGVFKEKNAARFASAFQRLLQHQIKL